MKKSIIFHPIVFALYPVFSLLSMNSRQIQFMDIIGTAVMVFIFSIIIWGGLYFAFRRNLAISASISSMFFLLFFSYGHVVNWIIAAGIRYRLGWLETFLHSGAETILQLTIWTGLLWAFTYLVTKTHLNLATLTSYFNVVAIVMTAALIYDLAKDYRNNLQEQQQQFTQEWRARLDTEFPSAQTNAPEHELPDIYYIILDGYARKDVLQDIYQYDNSEFLSFLKEQGFYVAEQSYTNYPQTVLSLTSSMNFMYLNELTAKVGANTSTLWPLRAMLSDNRLFRLLKEHGYLIRSLPTGFFYTENLEADVTQAQQIRLDAVQTALLNLTPLPEIANLFGIKDQADIHRERILYGFENLPAPEHAQPVFTFAHIVSPHPPFVFDAQGNDVDTIGFISMLDGDLYVGDRNQYVNGYRNQVIFINRHMEETLQRIMASSSRPLIIIIQGDHGPGSRLIWNVDKADLQERLSILNAYYFYDQNYRHLYPDITPVNTFRTILTQYLGAQYEPLEDRTYFANSGTPYNYTDVTDRLSHP